MKTLLIIDSSGRINRSVTRRLSQRLANAWRAQGSDFTVTFRDVAQHPPSHVNEAWIAGAFAAPESRTQEMLSALAESERLVDEFLSADAVALAAPMYNFGVPAPLKAYIDQIVRVGRTFGFDPEQTPPYLKIVPDRPIVVLTSAGDAAVFPGGSLHSMNHLEAHLKDVFGFMGITSIEYIRVGNDEFQDAVHFSSRAAAEAAVTAWAEKTAADLLTLDSVTSDRHQ